MNGRDLAMLAKKAKAAGLGLVYGEVVEEGASDTIYVNCAITVEAFNGMHNCRGAGVVIGGNYPTVPNLLSDDELVKVALRELDRAVEGA